MRKPRELEWGETPFDSLTANELKRSCQAMYSALLSARSALSILSATVEHQPFWSTIGTGGRAIAKCNSVLDPIHKKFDQGDIYRSFFRYADELLFPAVEKRGSGWYVCDCGCQTMVSSIKPASKPTNSLGSCKTPLALRPLRWSDLAPSLKHQSGLSRLPVTAEETKT